MSPDERRKLDRMFNPRGMAVFGNMSRPGSFGYGTVMSQLAYGYKGRLYPISPRGGDMAGLKVYRSLNEVDGPVDLATVTVPARFVPDVLRDCLKFGVAGAQILSSGFAETGESQGMALQKEITAIASKGLRIIGPNCFGIHSPRGGITLPPGSDFSREPGPVAMISQSGGGALRFAREALGGGLTLSKLISYGNGCDLEAVQLLEYLADDAETEYIAAYIEGVKDGQGFLKALKKLTPQKPVVIWKGGLTPLGSRATQSHTGSLGGQARIWKGALIQAGAVVVQGMDEVVDALMALKYLKNRGRKIALVGGGGAIGVFSCDTASRLGLEVPVFSPETRKRLHEHFPTPGNSVLNPLDTGTPRLPLELLAPMVEEILVNEPVNALVVVMLLHAVTRDRLTSLEGPVPPANSRYLEGLLEILSRLRTKTEKDIVVVFENWTTNDLSEVEVDRVFRQMRLQFQAEGIPVFPSTARALKGIRKAAGIKEGPGL